VSLSAAITRRPARQDDATAVAAVAGDDEAALLGHPSRLGPTDVLDWWGRTDLERNSWLLEEAGELVGVGWFESVDELGTFVGIVAQGAKGRGLGAALVDLGEAHAREAGAARAHTWTPEADSRARELFEAKGYGEVRRFYDMAIELETAPADPVLREGFRIEQFREEDARAFHDALDDAFQDHWEHHSVPFERWWEQKQASPGFDPTLWFVVRAGDEIAACIRNDPERNGGGYVGALGVRRQWRGQGLGRALLAQTFAEFHRRGVNRVTLGVDADSPTGATALYESSGMAVEMEAVVFAKELR